MGCCVLTAVCSSTMFGPKMAGLEKSDVRKSMFVPKVTSGVITSCASVNTSLR